MIEKKRGYHKRRWTRSSYTNFPFLIPSTPTPRSRMYIAISPELPKETGPIPTGRHRRTPIQAVISTKTASCWITMVPSSIQSCPESHHSAYLSPGFCSCTAHLTLIVNQSRQNKRTGQIIPPALPKRSKTPDAKPPPCPHVPLSSQVCQAAQPYELME